MTESGMTNSPSRTTESPSRTTESPSPHRLDGKTAVVTGAAQGLGLSMIEELAKEGADAIIADVQIERAESAAEALRNQGLSVTAGKLDVTDSDGVTAFFQSLVADGRTLDILVNSAGVGQKVSTISAMSDEAWEGCLAVTLHGSFYCCRAAADIMEDQEAGCIVNISSINGQSPAALLGAYNVAKAGIISLTQTMAIELAAYGVRVNAVCPGPVYTDFNKFNMAQRSQTLGISEEEMIERVRAAVPLGRWGEPFDIARGVVFLCSPAASWITGEILRVSGGLVGVSATPPKREKG